MNSLTFESGLYRDLTQIPANRAAVAALLCAAFGATEPEYSNMRTEEQIFEQDAERDAFSKNRMLVLAHHNQSGSVVGIGSVCNYSHPTLGATSYLFMGAVDLRFRNQGIGTRLIEERIKLIQDNDNGLPGDVVYADLNSAAAVARMAKLLTYNGYKTELGEDPRLAILHQPVAVRTLNYSFLDSRSRRNIVFGVGKRELSKDFGNRMVETFYPRIVRVDSDRTPQAINLVLRIAALLPFGIALRYMSAVPTLSLPTRQTIRMAGVR